MVSMIIDDTTTAEEFHAAYLAYLHAADSMDYGIHINDTGDNPLACGCAGCVFERHLPTHQLAQALILDQYLTERERRKALYPVPGDQGRFDALNNLIQRTASQLCIVGRVSHEGSAYWIISDLLNRHAHQDHDEWLHSQSDTMRQARTDAVPL